MMHPLKNAGEPQDISRRGDYVGSALLLSFVDTMPDSNPHLQCPKAN